MTQVHPPLRTFLLTLIASLWVITGCSSKNAVHVDSAVSSDIDIEQQIAEVDEETGLLRVSIEAKNTSSKPLTLYYQVDWYDENGRKIDSILSRKNRLVADKKRWFSIEAVAPSPEATDYRLYIDERKN